MHEQADGAQLQTGRTDRRIDLCPDTMHQAMTGAEAELHSPMVLREEKKKP